MGVRGVRSIELEIDNFRHLIGVEISKSGFQLVPLLLSAFDEEEPLFFFTELVFPVKKRGAAPRDRSASSDFLLHELLGNL